MELDLIWSRLFKIWFVFALVSAIGGTAVAAVLGSMVGLVGHLIGIAPSVLTTTGSVLGVVTYVIISMLSLKYALSKVYHGFRIVIVAPRT